VARAVAVLLHERDHTFSTFHYLIHDLMREWRAQGIPVRLVRGSAPVPADDLLIPHLDLTVTPDEYRALADRHPAVVNRRVLDISKSRVSMNLVARGDPYRGPVIVKTERNYGGLPERWLAGSSWVARLRRAVLRGPAPWTAWSRVDHLDPDRYPVFETLGEVPPGVFDNPHLLVERFVAERDGPAYVLRYTYCLGDRDASLAHWSRERVVKGENADRIETVPTPPGIDALRARLGLDYGKLDYVLRDGQVVLLDVNRTPAVASLDRAGLTRAIAARLAPGIAALLA
jgi:hypothetical protein